MLTYYPPPPRCPFIVVQLLLLTIAIDCGNSTGILPLQHLWYTEAKLAYKGSFF